MGELGDAIRQLRDSDRAAEQEAAILSAIGLGQSESHRGAPLYRRDGRLEAMRDIVQEALSLARARPDVWSMRVYPLTVGDVEYVIPGHEADAACRNRDPVIYRENYARWRAFRGRTRPVECFCSNGGDLDDRYSALDVYVTREGKCFSRDALGHHFRKGLVALFAERAAPRPDRVDD